MTQQTTDLWTAWTSRRDELAFESLVRAELPHALGFARRLGCSDADAQDALQDALARLASVRDDAPAAVGVRAWLCREVHVRARSRLRSERRRRTREWSVAVSDARAGGGEAVDARDAVEHALAGLDADQREAVTLRYLHDFDYREMALVLGASEGACRQRVHKALAGLRARLGVDAAALVAALPLPAVGDASTLVKGALSRSTDTGGSTVMATKTQTLAIAAALALALGVAGTLVVQRTVGAAPQSADVATNPLDAEIARRDAEIARLRSQLADTRRRGESRSAADARPDRVESQAIETAAVSRSSKSAPASDEATEGLGPGTNVFVKKPAFDTVDVLKRCAPWQKAIRQVADPARRDAAWAEVRQALAGADYVSRLAAMETVAATSAVKLDRAGLRDLLLPCIESTDAQTRLYAWPALIASGIEPVDVDKLRGQVVDGPRELRAEMLSRLNWATKGVIDGANADAALMVLDDPPDLFRVIEALQRARLTDPVVAKILASAKGDDDVARVAVEVLKTLPDKTHDVVALLLDRAEAGDMAAVETFEGTVRAQDVAYAGERLRRLFDARTQTSVRVECVATIGRIGDASSRDFLVAIRDEEKQDASIRESARKTIERLDRAVR